MTCLCGDLHNIEVTKLGGVISGDPIALESHVMVKHYEGADLGGECPGELISAKQQVVLHSS